MQHSAWSSTEYMQHMNISGSAGFIQSTEQQVILGVAGHIPGAQKPTKRNRTLRISKMKLLLLSSSCSSREGLPQPITICVFDLSFLTLDVLPDGGVGDRTTNLLHHLRQTLLPYTVHQAEVLLKRIHSQKRCISNNSLQLIAETRVNNFRNKDLNIR